MKTIACESIFSQILKLVSKDFFSKALSSFESDKWTKKLSGWEQLVCMIYCHLGHAKSLREISYGLQSCIGKINHLGLRQAPKRSTLSYANKTRPWEPFRELFYNMLSICRSQMRGRRKFRFKNKLFSLDATIVELCASMFDWAKYRKTKGAIKLHLLLDHDSYLPVFAHLTEGRVHEINVAKTLKLSPGSIVVMDRAYNDYGLFKMWNMAGIFFVTRLKSNAKYTVVKEMRVPPSGNIVSDFLIKLDKTDLVLRKITVWIEEKQEYMELLTNHMTLTATTVAAIYKDRWAIEQFFKTIKQHLRIKTFVGTSANAIQIQIWTALICILLVKYLQYLSSSGISLSNFVYILGQNLFVYRNLAEWLANPFSSPPPEPEYEQPDLFSFNFGQHAAKPT